MFSIDKLFYCSLFDFSSGERCLEDTTAIIQHLYMTRAGDTQYLFNQRSSAKDLSLIPLHLLFDKSRNYILNIQTTPQ